MLHQQLLEVSTIVYFKFIYFVMYGILFKSVRSKKEKKRNLNMNLQNDSFLRGIQ